MTLAPTGTLRIGASDLEYRMIGPAPDEAPSIVMLHEGLGSVGLWGDFPDRLQAATRACVFVYSRSGYGASTPVELPRPLDYMHIEALEILPKLLDEIGSRRGLLLGHSDGASIAAIYAGGVQDHRIRGVAMIAPHFVVEDISVKSIANRSFDETEALAPRRRQRVLRVERGVARPKVSRLGYFGISRLHTGAGCNPAGRRGRVWDNPPDRDRPRRMLLSGRCDDRSWRRTFAAS